MTDSRALGAPTSATPDDEALWAMCVRYGTTISALHRINATLHLSPRGPVSDSVRYGAAQLLAAWWTAVDEVGYSRDDLAAVGARLASVALDMAQMAERTASRSATIDAIRRRRAEDTPRIRRGAAPAPVYDVYAAGDTYLTTQDKDEAERVAKAWRGWFVRRMGGAR